MKIYHIRNATFVIEAGDRYILVDPMLGDMGSIPAFTYIRFKARRNPTVELPANYQSVLEKVTHCLITHLHPDHIDNGGKQFLINKNIPVICSIKDVEKLKKDGLNVTNNLKYWQKERFLDGTILGVPAKHGYDFIAKKMGNVMGFYLELPDTPSIYISSDTIYTDDVDKVLTEFKPDLTVLASGKAQLDIGKPILMNLKDIVKFVKKSPKKVYANHMESLNHCPTTREQLKNLLEQNKLLDKVYIPIDGESIDIE
jgi:L-ascorbate metabolism protein UlaG (beta-lactamase superfamily)